MISEILDIYEQIDQKTLRLKLATGLRCPAGCGACCESPQVEASILEALPLAQEIVFRNEAIRTLCLIEQSEQQERRRCVLFRSDPGSSKAGKCAYYGFRPLVCRLFGYSARKNRLGKREFCACRVQKEHCPEPVAILQDGFQVESGIPVNQDFFFRIASMHPGLGNRLFPINSAIRQALEYLYWKQPGITPRRKAA